MSKLRFIFDFLFNILSYFIKRNPNWIVFGSWHGKYFIDNPRYIYEYLLKKNNNYKLIWIGEKSLLNEIPKKENTLFVVKNSLRSIYFLLKSKYMFTTGGSDDLFLFNVYRNAVIINCWHGVPVKKICADSMGYKTPNKSIFIKLIKKICGHPITYSYYVSCSKKNDHVFLSAFRDIGIKDNQILKSGYPRNEIFFNADKSDFGRIKEKYSNILNFPVEKRVIMYLPTYRAKNIFYESFFYRKTSDKIILNDLLNKHNAVLIEKNHFHSKFHFNKERNNSSENGLVIRITKNMKVNIQELLLITDILISDYSGVFLDFIILDRPVIHFAYDYDYYRNIDTGLYYEIESFSAGPIAFTFKDVIHDLDKLLTGNDNFKDKRYRVRKEYMEYEIGQASKYICKKVLNI